MGGSFFLERDSSERLLEGILEIRRGGLSFYQKNTSSHGVRVDCNKGAPITREFFGKMFKNRSLFPELQNSEDKMGVPDYLVHPYVSVEILEGLFKGVTGCAG